MMRLPAKGNHCSGDDECRDPKDEQPPDPALGVLRHSPHLIDGCDEKKKRTDLYYKREVKETSRVFRVSISAALLTPIVIRKMKRSLLQK